MKLFIKVVGGKGYVIDIPEDSTVLQLKEELESAIEIPTEQQALLNMGKVLADDKPLSYYPTIKDGSKLNLVVKKPEPMDVILTRFLEKYYTEEESKKICEEFMKDFDKKVENFSLDELERMATSLLEEETEVGNEVETQVGNEAKTEIGNELETKVGNEMETEVVDEKEN